MNARRRYFDDAQRAWLRQWWKALQPRPPEEPRPSSELAGLGRGDRARLRRCQGLEDLMLERSVPLLAERLWTLELAKERRCCSAHHYYAMLARVAGALAHVVDDLPDGRSLAARLGPGIAPAGERPLMSELRFQRLMRCREYSDFHQQLVRALHLGGRRTDVAELGEDLLAWHLEQGVAMAPGEGVKLRWARDYYLSARQRAAEQSLSGA